jgi:hypothetical protein
MIYMTSQICRDVIGILGRYLPPLKAQLIVEKYCGEIDLSMNNFHEDEVPRFILYLAGQRDSVSKLDDNQFFSMLRNLVCFSNSKNDFVNREEIDKIRAEDGELS